MIIYGKISYKSEEDFYYLKNCPQNERMIFSEEKIYFGTGDDNCRL